jgi:hypothetical protein
MKTRTHFSTDTDAVLWADALLGEPTAARGSLSA